MQAPSPESCSLLGRERLGEALENALDRVHERGAGRSGGLQLPSWSARARRELAADGLSNREIGHQRPDRRIAALSAPVVVGRRDRGELQGHHLS